MAESRLHDQPEAADSAAQDSTAPQVTPQQMVYRRAPKITPFLVTGVVFGVVIACVWVGMHGATPEYSQTQTLGFLAAILGIAGLTLGALTWLVFDRRSKRQTETVLAKPTDNPDAADVALTEDDYREWSRVQQQARADAAHRQRRAEAKAAAKASKRKQRN